MSRYSALFSQLTQKKEGALIPFFVLGFPDREQCLASVDAAIAAGADALELGIPFSDPVADGPVIVEAANQARAAGIEPPQAFEIVNDIRRRHPSIPIGLLVYANLVIGSGMENFLRQCQNAGVDSVLVADIPLRESGDLRQCAARYGIEVVQILAPNASAEAAKAIAQSSQGYVYLLSRAGVTGAERSAGLPLSHLIDVLHTERSAPPIIGFGISNAEHVKSALQAGARGAIVGSALVGVMRGAKNDCAGQVSAFIAELKAATKIG